MPSDFRSEDVEAAGVSMLAEPPSYSQLYQHGGRQDHDNSDDGSESSLGEPPPYKSGMIYHYILSQIHIKWINYFTIFENWYIDKSFLVESGVDRLGM